MLESYEPHMEDLWFKEKMMDDTQTMPYNHEFHKFLHDEQLEKLELKKGKYIYEKIHINCFINNVHLIICRM